MIRFAFLIFILFSSSAQTSEVRCRWIFGLPDSDVYRPPIKGRTVILSGPEQRQIWTELQAMGWSQRMADRLQLSGTSAAVIVPASAHQAFTALFGRINKASRSEAMDRLDPQVLIVDGVPAELSRFRPLWTIDPILLDLILLREDHGRSTVLRIQRNSVVTLEQIKSDLAYRRSLTSKVPRQGDVARDFPVVSDILILGTRQAP